MTRDEHNFAVGDIVTARDGNDPKILWVGIIEGFTNPPGAINPKVRFWNHVQHRMVKTPLVMTTSGLTYIGSVPQDAVWDL